MNINVGTYLVPINMSYGGTITKVILCHHNVRAGPLRPPGSDYFECLSFYEITDTIDAVHSNMNRLGVVNTETLRKMREISIKVDDKIYKSIYNKYNFRETLYGYSARQARDDEIALFEKIYFVHKLQNIIET